jgi:cleavage and polyadenylation specificity factor subunit 1
MADLEYVRAYIDDFLIITNLSFEDHMEKLDEVLTRVQQAGLKINARKSFFAKSELEYLGYWITREGIQPLPKKIQAIANLTTPTTTKQVRHIVGMVNYYRDMWPKRSEILAPLTELCSKTTKFNWSDRQQKAFEEIKRTVTKETLLAYPDFNQPFVIHTDASDKQLGAVISQNEKPIAFYSRKLSPAQTRYTATERELLAIVETLKEFRNILLGQKITVYTDHENLTYKQFNTNRVMRWRLLLEEFGPELVHIKGSKNIVADALSRLPLKEFDTNELQTFEEVTLYNSEAIEEEFEIYPLSYKTILKHQKQDTELLNNAKNNTTNNYHFKIFRGGEKKYPLLCQSGKIVIPKTLQKRIVEWYHTTLLHPGETRTELTIRQHFTWKGVRTTVQEVCKNCPTCQRTKRSNQKYGIIPIKEADAGPWEKVCIDMIGPYTIKQGTGENANKITIHCVTMIDPATGWFEMVNTTTKDAATIADIVETTWLTRYPIPQEIIYDRGTEFLGEFA